MMMANVAAVPARSRLVSDMPISRTTMKNRKTDPVPTIRRTVGTGADTSPLTWPTRQWTCGSRMSTANRNSAGITGRTSENALSGGMYPTASESSTPSPMAPTNVRGRLRSRPIIAAAYALMTRSVSW